MSQNLCGHELGVFCPCTGSPGAQGRYNKYHVMTNLHFNMTKQTFSACVCALGHQCETKVPKLVAC